MAEVGLREMRQHASELVKRAERGEQLTITVSGRPAAVLGPLHERAWRRWEDVADVIVASVDEAWAADRDLVDQRLAVRDDL
jgi:prevent-host-death family protein